MKYLLIKDKKRRTKFKNFELKQLYLKTIINSLNIDKEKKIESINKLTKINRQYSKVKLVNRCTITGKSHGVYRKFKLSRMFLKNYASNGKLVGIRKSSW